MKSKILLVDDEPLNLLTFEAFLADDGYEIHTAGDGRTAIELARSVSPDVILLDVMMPEIDGFTVCREIRRDPVIGHVHIIIVTALHDNESRLEGLRAGADDFLTKPCSRDEIRARLRTIAKLNRFRTIAEQRARFQRLYELAPFGFVLTDELGKVITANPCAEGLLGGPDLPPLPGQLIEARFDASYAAVIRETIAGALDGSTPPHHDIGRGPRERFRIIRITAAAVPDDGACRAMLLFRDVTDEVQARQAIERMNRELDELVRARTQQLEQANGLLMSYASFVSHDLRSPLAVMKGYLSLLHEGAVPLAEAAPMIGDAYNAAVMMEELIQNILQLARDEHEGASAAPFPAIDPSPIVTRVWSHIASLVPHPARRFSVAGLGPVAGNALLIERVFYNLLLNAAKFSAHRADPVIEVGVIATASGPAIFVRDNGVGFDARDADKLFGEFSQLASSPRSEGLGLGLSLVARLIRAHGGRLWAEGQRDAGATFYVQFGPADEAVAVA
jgi:signal transduction histidine kinase